MPSRRITPRDLSFSAALHRSAETRRSLRGRFRRAVRWDMKHPLADAMGSGRRQMGLDHLLTVHV